MAGEVTFSGLASGLDTKSIVEKLVALRKSQTVKPLEDSVAELAAEKTAIGPLLSAVSSLRAAANVLKNTANVIWNTKTGVSSDTNKILVNTVDSTLAVSGTYGISSVSALAQADRVIYQGIANRDTTQLGSGNITIAYNGVTTTVSIAAGTSTLNDIMAAINSSTSGVKASIVNDGSATPYRLILTGNDTGTSFAITDTIPGGISLTKDAALSALAANEPANAAFLVNGISISSQTNAITTAIPGTTFTLLAVDTTNTNNVTVKQDTSQIVTQITAFVTAYTAAKKALREAILPDSSTGKFGPLGHETFLSTANAQLSNMMARKFNSLTGYLYSALSGVGITTNFSGDYQVDTAKLQTALENHNTDVRLLFQGSTLEDGIAESVYNYTDNMVHAGGTFGAKIDSINRQTILLNKKLIDRKALLNSYQKTLSKKFNKMEQVLTQLKAQGDSVQSFSNATNG